MPLNQSLQAPLECVFDRLVTKAEQTSAKTSTGKVLEVDWIEKFHWLVDASLANEVRQTLRGVRISQSVSVESALIHGSPFQVSPAWNHGGGVEIGDLLLAGQRLDRNAAVIERQALLLQMKVDKPPIKDPPPRRDSSSRQATLFATWPPFEWKHAAMRCSVPPPSPRTPNPGPCDAAQFGIISGSRAYRLIGVGAFHAATPLAREMARAVRLDIGVKATPGPPDGWPRIVQDILEVAPQRTFHARPRHVSVQLSGKPQPVSRGRSFLVIVVSHAPTGILD